MLSVLIEIKCIRTEIIRDQHVLSWGKGLAKESSMQILIQISPYLSTPLAFLKTVLHKVSPDCPDLSHPLCGIITIFTNTNKASSIIVLFKSSQELRFQRTPVTKSFTSLSWVFLNNLTSAFVPPATLIALLFSSFWRPYDRFLQNYDKLQTVNIWIKSDGNVTEAKMLKSDICLRYLNIYLNFY